MLKQRTVLALVFLVVLAAGTGYSLTRPDPNVRGDTQESERQSLPTFSADQIDQLEIAEKGKDTVVLSRKDGAWQITKPVTGAADKNNIKQALGALAKLRFKDLIAESESSHKTLQVLPEQVVTVTVTGGGKAVATMHVGRTGNIRLGDSNQVWSASGLNRFTLAREVRLWRDREIVRFDVDAVVTVDFIHADGKRLVFGKQTPQEKNTPTTWEPKEGQALVGGKLDSQQVASAVSMFARLDASDFPDNTDAALTGLVAPRVKIVAHLGEEKTVEVWIGAESGGGVFARREGSLGVWLINKSIADAMLKAPTQWRDKTIVKVPSTDVKRMVIKKGKSHIVFALQKDKSWKSVGPTVVAKPDPAKVQTISRGLQNLRAQSIVLSSVPAKTALARPTGSLALTTKDGKVTTLIVGALVENQYYAKLAGAKDVYLVNKYFIEQFLLNASDFAPAPAPAPTRPRH